MNRKVLCVDDDPAILYSFQRNLRKEFKLKTAEGGAKGLALIKSEGPFAVVVSDMRMPEMDGIQFLSQVKELAPDTLRVMLTGNADQKTAMDAVNEGSIFRFLTKPCTPEELRKALRAGLEQYRLVTAEKELKELLEETLNRSLQVIVELLAKVNSTAFCRMLRVKRMALDISQQLGVPNLWQIELAATLSQVGAITIPQEILLKVINNQPLFPEEQALYESHPETTYKLLARIPRLQTVAEVIAHQNYRFDEQPPSLAKTSDPALVKCCAQILRVAGDFDRLVYSGYSPQAAWYEMTQREGWYLPLLLDTLKQLIGNRQDESFEIRLPIADLQPGMILDQVLQSHCGEPLLAAGKTLTESLILRLDDFLQMGLIGPEVSVKTPLNLAENKGR